MLVTPIKGDEPSLARAALEAPTTLTDDDSRSLASKARIGAAGSKHDEREKRSMCHNETSRVDLGRHGL